MSKKWPPKTRIFIISAALNPVFLRKKTEVPSDFRFSNYIFDYQSMSEAWGIRTPDNLIKRHPLKCDNHAVLRHLMDKKWTCYFLYKSYTVHTY